MRYLCSDLHINHFNVINYCLRPYSSKEEMNDAIVNIWNAKVKDEDEVYVIGDVALNYKYACQYGKRLNGKRYLVSGNHDQSYWWPNRSKEKIIKIREEYEKAGWNILPEKTKLTLSNGLEVLMCHFPYASETQKDFDQRYWQERPKDEGLFLLNGHLHGKYLKHGRSIDIGWDQKLDLFSEQEVIDIINDPRDYIPGRLTDFYKTRDIKGQENY